MNSGKYEVDLTEFEVSPQEKAKMLIKLLGSEKLKNHAGSCSGNDCSVCLKLIVFTKILAYGEKNNCIKLEMEKISEEEIEEFFFQDDLLKIEFKK